MMLLTAMMMMMLTCCADSLNERREAEGLYRRALAVSERCLGTTHLQVADILAELGQGFVYLTPLLLSLIHI